MTRSRGPIATEKKTVAAMVHIYCAEHHPDAGGICTDCGTLLAYAHARLDGCPYGADKPSCKTCPTHCYKPEPRERMRTVMREAGPRMLWKHPWLTMVHLWKDRFHVAPRRRSRRTPAP
jgi:predicted amidophosphoribosyltransferase